MGIFSVFAGFMYNDFFSVGFTWLFLDSGFKDTDGPGPYPFGLDWAWHGATNELLFVNSLKMKLSVLFGVLQMIVGLVLRFSDAIYDKKMIDLAFECVPMLVFMVC